ncbi:hypothetical protein DVU_0555 [Nitratidesulfovibrio vulgaris str. Hildenborough]|uniref:Uncharacterized protein n=1 Tax=Nitratidesulfovibrio vulgaris (strain ATCC 29579 / DSM 644 / CCUG 34227 / NCIMB 8303 / VKM B-1760 / Hildenborough) TaxID=882 RepID=Q72EM2_NITV2|nr:hypothetical protein DVU_0555 [Nitratidesulfovibrio vulgaris str. Hildenborough]
MLAQKRRHEVNVFFPLSVIMFVAKMYDRIYLVIAKLLTFFLPRKYRRTLRAILERNDPLTLALRFIRRGRYDLPGTFQTSRNLR